MLVKFSRVNEDDNSFDQIFVVDDVSLNGFEAAQKFESAADEPKEVVADLYDDCGIRDTIFLTRQRMVIAAVAMKKQNRTMEARPMTCVQDCQREADLEKRIAGLEAERADLRQRLMGGVELVRSGRYLTAWAEENAKYLKEKTPSRPIANSRMEG